MVVLTSIMLLSQDKLLLRAFNIKMPSALIEENLVICRGTVTKLLKVSGLKMSSVSCENMILSTGEMNKLFPVAMGSWDINQKEEGLGFLGYAGIVARTAIWQMNVSLREISKVIAYHQETALGAWLEAWQHKVWANESDQIIVKKYVELNQSMYYKDMLTSEEVYKSFVLEMLVCLLPKEMKSCG